MIMKNRAIYQFGRTEAEPDPADLRIQPLMSLLLSEDHRDFQAFMLFRKRAQKLKI